MSQENAEHILLELCALPIKWSGHKDMPKTWISAIRKINEKWIAVEKEQTEKKKSEVSEGTTLKSRRPRKRYKKAGRGTVDEAPKLSIRRRRGR
jgi:hypothetical protein